MHKMTERGGKIKVMLATRARARARTWTRTKTRARARARARARVRARVRAIRFQKGALQSFVQGDGANERAKYVN